MGDNGNGNYLPAPKPKRKRGRKPGTKNKVRNAPDQYDPEALDGFTKLQSRILLNYVKDPRPLAKVARDVGCHPITVANLMATDKAKEWLASFRKEMKELPEIQRGVILSQEQAILTSDIRKLPRMPSWVKEMDDETAAAISSIAIYPKTYMGKVLTDPATGEMLYDVRFTFWSKDRSLERTERMHGMFERDNLQKPGTQVHGDVNITQNNVTMDISDIPRELRREFVRAFARKRDAGDVVDVEAVGDE